MPLLLIGIECVVGAWRHVGIEASDAPLFSWNGGKLQTSAQMPFGAVIKIYGADRGVERNLKLQGNRKLTVFYFEWDQIDAGPFSGLDGHESEVCNVAAGFAVKRTGGLRKYISGNHPPLVFRITELTQPNGDPVYVYKLPWMQGVGEWQTTSSKDRKVRLQRSFLRHRGAARVLQGGIFGASSEDEAWAIFEREVLSQIEWEVPTK